MDNTASTTTRLVITIRWMARIIGTLAVAVFLVFFVADCVNKGRIAIGSDRVLMTAFQLLAFIGLSIAWKWEGIGGATALGGLIGFNIFAPASAAKAGIFVITGLYGLPALLFLFCWFRTRTRIHPKAT